MFQDIDIGTFTDSAVPLEYCCRLIAKSFLLTGHPNNTVPDKSVRISVKSLALSCISSAVQYYPKALLLYLDKSSAKTNVVDSAKNSSSSECPKQQMSDILLFGNHADPQLRGTVSCLVGNFIKAVLVHSQSDYDRWLAVNIVTDEVEVYQMRNLIQLLVKVNNIEQIL